MTGDRSIGEAAPEADQSTRKGRGRREQIATIASGLFARNGFDGTSIRDIAEAAGLTKPALYYHFQDKEALFEHVVAERMGLLIACVRKAAEGSDDPIEKIRRFIAGHARRMDRERDAWMISRQSFLSLSDEARRKRVNGLRDEFEHILRDLLAGAMQAKRLDHADPAIVARLMLSSVNDVPRWLKPGGDLTAGDVARTYGDIVLRGLGAEIPLR